MRLRYSTQAQVATRARTCSRPCPQVRARCPDFARGDGAKVKRRQLAAHATTDARAELTLQQLKSKGPEGSTVFWGAHVVLPNMCQ
eukprot:12373075-Alexandrium_andersonii.AAC.1